MAYGYVIITMMQDDDEMTMQADTDLVVHIIQTLNGGVVAQHLALTRTKEVG
jgi:hypothetical protein